MNSFQSSYLGNTINLMYELAKPFEGLSLKAYRDVAGYPTIGYGHLLTRNKEIPLTQFNSISIDEADNLLKADLLIAVRGCLRYSKGATLNPQQLAALGDFCFNLGVGTYQSSTLRKCILRGDFDQVPYQLSRFNKSAGIVYRGLVRRRTAEAALFCS